MFQIDTASFLTNKTGFTVNYAPLLSQIPKSTKGQVYVFSNGPHGNGTFGFQSDVMSTNPSNKEYSPLLQLNFVKWNSNANTNEIKSIAQLNLFLQNNKLTINKTDIVVNHPAIKWNSGSLKIRDNKSIGDESSYMGGQY